MALLHGSVLPAWAESRTPPEATQHALDELANCRAQNRPGAGQMCPTETATPSPTPRPTSTPQPAASATTEPVEVAPTATPLPVMPVGGDGYMRPLDDHWLELALQQGRWAVYQADDCSPRVDAWVNVVTQVQGTGEVDLLGEAADCGLVAERWLSDAPCSVNDQGTCDVSADTSFWDMLSHLPTATPALVPPVAPTRAATQSQARQPAAAVPQAQVRTVVQTVVVLVTAAPTETPLPTPTGAVVVTSSPTRTPTATPIVTSTATPSPIVAVAVPTRAQGAPDPSTQQQLASWDWTLTFEVLGIIIALAAAVIWLVTRRRLAVW